MQITVESLKENIRVLEEQRERGFSLYNQANGAIQLANALIERLMTEEKEKENEHNDN